MVPIARIFVVGVDCMAVCPYPVVKPARPSITARPATRAYFIYLPLLTEIEVDLTVLAFAPKTLSRPLGQPGQHHGLECLGIRDELLIDLARLSAGDDFVVGVGRDRIDGVRDELLRRHAGLRHSSRSHTVSVCTARTPATCAPSSARMLRVSDRLAAFAERMANPADFQPARVASPDIDFHPD